MPRSSTVDGGSTPPHEPGSASRKRGNHIVPVRYGGQHEQVKAAVGGRSYSGVIEPSPRNSSVGRASEQTLADVPSVKVGRNETDRPANPKSDIYMLSGIHEAYGRQTVASMLDGQAQS